jgi:hypothetical protein
MLQTVFKLAFVSVAVNPNVYSIPVGLTHAPLPDVAVSLGSLPHSGAVLESSEPLSLIKLSVWPVIFANSFRPAVDVVSLVDGASWKDLIARTMFIILFPVTFVEPIIIVDHDTLSVAPFIG